MSEVVSGMQGKVIVDSFRNYNKPKKRDKPKKPKRKLPLKTTKGFG